MKIMSPFFFFQLTENFWIVARVREVPDYKKYY